MFKDCKISEYSHLCAKFSTQVKQWQKISSNKKNGKEIDDNNRMTSLQFNDEVNEFLTSNLCEDLIKMVDG